jgi:hypothetical protein
MHEQHKPDPIWEPVLNQPGQTPWCSMACKYFELKAREVGPGSRVVCTFWDDHSLVEPAEYCLECSVCLPAIATMTKRVG